MAKVRDKARLRQKELEDIVAALEQALGWSPFANGDAVDTGEVEGMRVLLARGRVEGLLIDGQPFPALRGLLRHGPERRFVDVDAGAIPHVTNGAHVMAPGIVDADRAITPGDLVWVRDATHKRPLAVGKALLPGEELATGKSARRKGRAVETLHHVGDHLWDLEV